MEHDLDSIVKLLLTLLLQDLHIVDDFVADVGLETLLKREETFALSRLILLLDLLTRVLRASPVPFHLITRGLRCLIIYFQLVILLHKFDGLLDLFSVHTVQFSLGKSLN